MGFIFLGVIVFLIWTWVIAWPLGLILTLITIGIIQNAMEEDY